MKFTYAQQSPQVFIGKADVYNLQEEFESLKDAVSATLGDAQHKTYDVQQLTAASPTAPTTAPTTAFVSSKISAMTPAKTVGNNGLAEVQYVFES